MTVLFCTLKSLVDSNINVTQARKENRHNENVMDGRLCDKESDKKLRRCEVWQCPGQVAVVNASLRLNLEVKRGVVR